MINLVYPDKSIRLYESILNLEPANLLMMNNLAYAACSSRVKSFREQKSWR